MLILEALWSCALHDLAIEYLRLRSCDVGRCCRGQGQHKNYPSYFVHIPVSFERGKHRRSEMGPDWSPRLPRFRSLRAAPAETGSVGAYLSLTMTGSPACES